MFRPYWILPQDGDPLPLIGCGFRHVFADVGTRMVRIKRTEDDPKSYRVTLRKWQMVPNVEDTGQSLTEATKALRQCNTAIAKAADERMQKRKKRQKFGRKGHGG